MIFAPRRRTGRREGRGWITRGGHGKRAGLRRPKLCGSQAGEHRCGNDRAQCGGVRRPIRSDVIGDDSPELIRVHRRRDRGNGERGSGRTAIGGVIRDIHEARGASGLALPLEDRWRRGACGRDGKRGAATGCNRDANGLRRDRRCRRRTAATNRAILGVGDVKVRCAVDRDAVRLVEPGTGTGAVRGA